ncbi:MAG: AAA family ATPase [Burkholderiaceae bacterium]
MSTAPIVALVGLCGTGKSEAGRVLENLGYELVYFGGVVVDEVKKRGLPVNEANEKAVREELRATHGMAAMAIIKLPQIQQMLAAGKKVAVDGLYSFAEYELLKKTFGDRLKLIALHTAKPLRYARMAARPVRPLTQADVDARDFFEIKNLDKGGPIAIADAHVVNDDSTEQFAHALREAMASFQAS